jgi:hypothetical protein
MRIRGRVYIIRIDMYLPPKRQLLLLCVLQWQCGDHLSPTHALVIAHAMRKLSVNLRHHK